MRHILLMAAAVGLVLAAAAAGAPAQAQEPKPPENWPRFLGPNGRAVVQGVTFPATWTNADYAWTADLPGGGHSSAVVWGDRLFITSGDQKTATRTIQCYRAAEGTLVWTKAYSGSPCRQNSLNAYAATTPALDAERLYVSWASPERYIVVALTHAGDEVWRLDLGPWKSQHGYGQSPMVVGDTVILTNDQQGPSFIVALDAATGKMRWKAGRPGKEKAAYAVPCLFQPPTGSPYLIVMSKAAGVAGLDPATGRQLWQVPDAMPERVVSSPTLAGDLVLGTCGTGGRGRHVVAVRPPALPGGQAEVAWTVTKNAPYVPTSIWHKGRVLLWSDKGVVSCVKADSGDVIWSERLGGGTYYASPILVGDKVYNTSTKGKMVVLKMGDAFERLGDVDLGEKCHATPAVAGGRMFLRTWSRLMCLPAEK